MTPRKQSSSSWLSYLLMGGILTFGAGAASLVLSDHSSTSPSESVQKPVQPPRMPQPAASHSVLRAASAPVAVKPTATVASAMPMTAVPSAEEASSAAAVEPTAPVQAIKPSSVPVTASAVTASVTKTAVADSKAATTPAKSEATPTAPVVTATPVAVAPTVAATKEPAAAKQAPKTVEPAVSPAAKPLPKAVEPEKKSEAKSAEKSVDTVVPVKKTATPTKAERAQAAKAAQAAQAAQEAKAAKAAKAAGPAPKLPVLAAPNPALAITPPVPTEMLLKPSPRLEHAATEQAQIIAEAAPRTTAKTDAKSNGASVAVNAIETPKTTVRPARATSPVPSNSKPTVVMANGDKAWVKIDDQRTVIVTKGQEVPGLGTFHGADKGAAKFDSGNVPVNQ